MIVSRQRDFESARMAIEHGVELYILKPVAPTEIASCMAQMICEIHDSRKMKNKKQDDILMCGFCCRNILQQETGGIWTSL